MINLMTLTAEIRGVALALQLVSSVDYLLWVPFAAVAVWLVIWRVKFSIMENVAGPRFGGRPPESHMQRTPWVDVVEIGVVIKLGVGRDTLDLTWTERWVRDNVIGRIPGGRHIPGRKQNNHSEDNKRGGS